MPNHPLVPQAIESEQLALFQEIDELAAAIKKIDVMNLTPMEAMNQLYELKKMV